MLAQVNGEFGDEVPDFEDGELNARGKRVIVVESRGLRIVASGDYKRERDPTCAGFEPVPCDIFITEATFGLPLFTHPPINEEMAKLLERLAADPETRLLLVDARGRVALTGPAIHPDLPDDGK